MDKDEIKKNAEEAAKTAMELIYEEGHGDGWAAAVKAYKPEYVKILKKGRRQGIAMTITAAIVGLYFFIKYKFKSKEADKKETVINIEPEEFDEEVTTEP